MFQRIIDILAFITIFGIFLFAPCLDAHSKTIPLSFDGWHAQTGDIYTIKSKSNGERMFTLHAGKIQMKFSWNTQEFDYYTLQVNIPYIQNVDISDVYISTHTKEEQVCFYNLIPKIIGNEVLLTTELRKEDMVDFLKFIKGNSDYVTNNGGAKITESIFISYGFNHIESEITSSNWGNMLSFFEE